MTVEVNWVVGVVFPEAMEGKAARKGEARMGDRLLQQQF